VQGREALADHGAYLGGVAGNVTPPRREGFEPSNGKARPSGRAQRLPLEHDGF
jgi:hypothetical protein